ncbi:winged helix DNA-binding domain-containing protein [Actinocrispum sp. NPDC049592]|uniref:winged helix DNA-binding domain-containing protein n=1 Tax=Actinocrispum sp. NPDC049592 TaxID=3154835 RepID=UPI003429092A
MSLDWTQICAQRLARHHLLRPHTDLTEVVRAMCGAHAQIMAAGELSVGIRTNASRGDVQHALWHDRTLVKTFGPRGTVHFLPTADLPLWTAALSAIPGQASGFAEGVRMTPDQTRQVIDAIGIALKDAELTVDELTEALVDLAGPWAGEKVMPAFQTFWPRWRQATTEAANSGVLCFGLNKGRKVTYTNPHRWLPGLQPVDPDQALAELVNRYLHAYGPATPAQFARWLSASPAWAAKLFASLDLRQVDVAGTPAWLAAGDTLGSGENVQGVRLLPYFDAYTVGCFPRELVFPGRAFERVLNRGQAGNYPVLLVDGVIKGVWHQRRSGRKIDVTVEPFGKLTARQHKDLEGQVDRAGEIQDGKATLTIGTVTVGPHA